jgi:hypothetical protein
MLYRCGVFEKSKVCLSPVFGSHSLTTRNSESDTLNADIVDATMEGRKLDSEDSDVLVIDAVPAGVQVRLSYDVTNSSEERSHPTG